eukprot:scaffold1469_cov119-Cylindrotheca_fusiformis.AAC.32
MRRVDEKIVFMDLVKAIDRWHLYGHEHGHARDGAKLIIRHHWNTIAPKKQLILENSTGDPLWNT